MPKIELITEINSSLEICFNLSRSIDLHQLSTAETKERAIAGKTAGLISMNDYVTWEAIHFGVKQKLTSKITGYNYPHYFKDEQLQGAFKSFEHEHLFEQVGKVVIMKDIFTFSSPLGILGKIANQLFLTNYMRKFLLQRNLIIKDFAETDKWKVLLDDNNTGFKNVIIK